MASWDMGYQTDILYTMGYFSELSPFYLNFILTMQGYECPDLSEEVTACELGFGQGLTITINAMTEPVRWYGNDFNPSQVRFAQSLVRQAGLKSEKISLYDDSFEQFLDREDLPMFDYICLHGIWSWVSPENQHFIVEFIRKKLKLGGVVYLSYNTAPAYTLFEPVRHLMYRFDKDINGQHMDEREKFANIAKFINAIFDANPKFAKMVPDLEERSREVVTKDYQYLAGEYFNQHWDICHFDSVAERLEPAKVSFACSATHNDLVDRFIFTPEQQEFLAPYKHTVLGECVGDVLRYQSFRRDIFIKGLRKLGTKEHEAKLNQQFVMLTRPLFEVPHKINTPAGEEPLSKLQLKICGILADYKPHSIQEIKQRLKALPAEKAAAQAEQAAQATQAQATPATTTAAATPTAPENHGTVQPELCQQINEAIRELFSLKLLINARDPSTITPEEIQCSETFNQKVLENEFDVNIPYVACPVLGGGVGIPFLERQLLVLFRKFKAQAQEQGVAVDKFAKMINVNLLAEMIANDLVTKSQYVMIEDEKVTDRDRIVAHLRTYLCTFRDSDLPYYRALGLI